MQALCLHALLVSNSTKCTIKHTAGLLIFLHPYAGILDSYMRVWQSDVIIETVLSANNIGMNEYDNTCQGARNYRVYRARSVRSSSNSLRFDSLSPLPTSVVR